MQTAGIVIVLIVARVYSTGFRLTMKEWPARIAVRRAVDGSVQLLYKTDLSAEEYIGTQAWRDAKLSCCPMHPDGGCRFARHGYTGISLVLIKAHRRLGITPLQMNIIIQLLSYWHDPDRPPFPSKKELADRIGVTSKTIQNNIRALENVGLIKREQRKTASGDWKSNIYHLDGLVEQIRKIEPDFAKAKEMSRNALRRAETPVGRRKSGS